jgi:DNA-binding transcriptional LysR family regulator
MTLQQLRYLVAVVDTGSFTAAARTLHVAQPSLSQQVRALEAELGGDLVERLPRGVRLTSAGTALLPKARAALHAADQAAGLARRAIVDGPGNVCLAVAPAMPAAWVTDAVVTVARQAPERRVRWHDYASQGLVEEKVRGNGVGSIGLGLRPNDWSGPEIALGSDPYVLAVAADDPLAAAFAAAGFLPDERYEIAGARAALALVSAGLGVAVVPSSVVALEHAAVSVVAIEDAPRRELYAFGDASWPDAALDVVEALVACSAAGAVAPATSRQALPSTTTRAAYGQSLRDR